MKKAKQSKTKRKTTPLGQAAAHGVDPTRRQGCPALRGESGVGGAIAGLRRGSKGTGHRMVAVRTERTGETVEVFSSADHPDCIVGAWRGDDNEGVTLQLGFQPGLRGWAGWYSARSGR